MQTCVKRRSSNVVGRFAPSPTGRMHAGNIFAALTAWLFAKSQSGSIVLRIEDLDQQRSKPEYIDQIQRDFESLGLYWDRGPFFQSDRQDAYAEAFNELCKQDLIYPCFCSRADLHASSAPHFGEKIVYPGTCRNLSKGEVTKLSQKKNPAYRLIVPNEQYSFVDAIQGCYTQNLADECGDFIVRRSDSAFAYQLAVVVDDIEQGITEVVRGVDLLCSTPQQMYLQKLLGASFDTSHAHVPLLVSQENRRLSKRDKDASLDHLLEKYITPQAVIGHIAYVSGLIDREESLTPSELLEDFDATTLGAKLHDLTQISWQN